MTEPASAGITFLRSTTTTTVDREADGDTKTRVEHRARFAVREGTIEPQFYGYASLNTDRKRMSPNWCEAVWLDGTLNTVAVSGPRLLKDDSYGKETGRKIWGSQWSRDKLELSELPAPLAAAIGDYEVAVSTVTGRS